MNHNFKFIKYSSYIEPIWKCSNCELYYCDEPNDVFWIDSPPYTIFSIEPKCSDVLIKNIIE